MAKPSPRLGLVLPAGGARAAYQVGVLRYVAEAFPKFRPTIFTGISAGSINASYLAQGDPFPVAANKLYNLWLGLYFDQIFRTNFNSFMNLGYRWFSDLFLSRVTHRLLVSSLLDASPLAQTLISHLHFWKVSKAIRSGQVKGLAVSATNYHSGWTTIFFDSNEPVPAWEREQRHAIRAPIRMRHIMASCSIPILFEPIRIGDYFYGDGSLRFSYPISPAIRLGSSHVFCVGIKSAVSRNAIPPKTEHVGLGYVAGTVLNSIFLDSLEADFENLKRINRLVGTANPDKLEGFLIRPSQDLGGIAKDFVAEVPFHFRQLLRSTASTDELGDLLSYLMFSPGYLKALLELGMKDGESQHKEIAQFLSTLP